MALPDFLIIGSPKAGSTALHVALAQHPDLFLSNPKEPKYFMCDQAKPDPPSRRDLGTRTAPGNGYGIVPSTRPCSGRLRLARCAARAPRSTSGTKTLTAGSTCRSRTSR